MKTVQIFASGLIASMLALSSGQVFAYYCSEPSEPSCLRYGSGFSSRSEFDSCKWEVERYLREVSDYQQCLQNEIEEASTEARKVVEKFNCYAEGQSFCY